MSYIHVTICEASNHVINPFLPILDPFCPLCFGAFQQLLQNTVEALEQRETWVQNGWKVKLQTT